MCCVRSRVPIYECQINEKHLQRFHNTSGNNETHPIQQQSTTQKTEKYFAYFCY